MNRARRGVGKGFLERGQSYMVAHALDMDRVECFDILDACMSWTRAIVSSRPVRLLVAISAVSPAAGEWLCRKLRTYSVFEAVAKVSGATST